jgi:hypothetical protein
MSAADASSLDTVPSLGHHLANKDFLIIITHDCDLLNHDFEREPYVEFVWAKYLDQPPTGELLHGKSPRQLVLSTDRGDFEISIHSRCRVGRPTLCDLMPAGILDKHNLRLLRRWLASRYQRAGFPDAFNDRISKAQDRIYKKLKKSGHDITGIYLGIRDEELNDDEAYKVIVIGTMLSRDYRNYEVRTQVQRTIAEVASLLDRCDGIEVVEDALRPESEVSLDDLRVFARWDVEFISFRTSDVGAMAMDP